MASLLHQPAEKFGNDVIFNTYISYYVSAGIGFVYSCEKLEVKLCVS